MAREDADIVGVFGTGWQAYRPADARGREYQPFEL